MKSSAPRRIPTRSNFWVRFHVSRLRRVPAYEPSYPFNHRHTLAKERSMTKQISFNLFEMNCVGHISHGLWAHPENTRHRFNDIDFWIQEARLLEEGLFDSVFLADVIGTYDGYRNGPETALAESVQIPSNDPLLVIPAMAAVTKHPGLRSDILDDVRAAIFSFASTRFDPRPSDLREGTSAGTSSRRTFRTPRATSGSMTRSSTTTATRSRTSFFDVLYKLWEGSWDDDAVVIDRANNIWLHRPVEGALHQPRERALQGRRTSISPSRRRNEPRCSIRPVLSPRGREFAAKHAEAVFVGGANTEDYRDNIADVRKKAQLFGSVAATRSRPTRWPLSSRARPAKTRNARRRSTGSSAAPRATLPTRAVAGSTLPRPRDALVADIIEGRKPPGSRQGRGLARATTGRPSGSRSTR